MAFGCAGSLFVGEFCLDSISKITRHKKCIPDRDLGLGATLFWLCCGDLLSGLFQTVRCRKFLHSRDINMCVGGGGGGGGQCISVLRHSLA